MRTAFFSFLWIDLLLVDERNLFLSDGKRYFRWWGALLLFGEKSNFLPMRRAYSSHHWEDHFRLLSEKNSFSSIRRVSSSFSFWKECKFVSSLRRASSSSLWKEILLLCEKGFYFSMRRASFSQWEEFLLGDVMGFFSAARKATLVDEKGYYLWWEEHYSMERFSSCIWYILPSSFSTFVLEYCSLSGRISL